MGLIDDTDFTALPPAAVIVLGSPLLPLTENDIKHLHEHVDSGGSVLLLSKPCLGPRTGQCIGCLPAASQNVLFTTVHT